jgi:hypothetical protein
MRNDIFPCAITFYHIYCKNAEIIDSYIGHTNKFAQRVREHKSRCMNPADPAYDRPLYISIRANGGLDNWVFEQIEKTYCETCDIARHIEQDFVYIHGANLNSSRAFTRRAPSSNTYYAVHREAILTKYKEARLEQKERHLMAQNDILCV